MTDISATAFFRSAGQPISFEHEEEDTGGSKWPTRVTLHAVHPETGDRMGSLKYRVPRRKADKIAIDRLETHPDHQRKGVGSALMDEMQRRHPSTPIDHGDRTSDGAAWWKGYTDGKTVSRGRTMAMTHPGPAPESFARQDGEDWGDHITRVRHGLSMGHLTYEQARGHGYTGDARQDTRHDGWGPAPTKPKGWQPLPQTMYHTTTDAAGVMEHGLKTGQDLGQRNGHGLGGTPEWLSMTPSAEHAHTMLHALHEYHDHLNGKTSFADLHHAAENAEGAQHPYHKALMDTFGWENEHGVASRMRGKRIEPGFATYDEAKEKGWEPHPTLHQNFGEDKHGRSIGTGWERPTTIEERHDEYGAFSQAREFQGKGTKSTLFMGNDRKAFAQKDPSNFAVLKLRPKPGAHGFPGGDEGEWRTGTGDAVEVHGEPLRRTSARIGHRRTASVQDGDDVPSLLLNPHGHHVKAKVGGYTNVQMVPRHEIERYASQPTDDAHMREVGRHIATSGEIEPLILHYHPASAEAYLGEGNHRLRASKHLKMDHLPLRVERASGGLNGPGVATPQLHPAQETGDHIPAEIKPSDLGLTAVDKPTIPQAQLDEARHTYNLLHPRNAAIDGTPVPDNHEPYQHPHDWLPHDHFFAPAHKDLDPRLFDGDRMHPAVRQHILSLLNGFWAPKYGDSWQSWARVYLAGSEASHFYGNNDLDVLIGIDYEAAREKVPVLEEMSDEEISTHLTDELRQGLNDDQRMLPGPDGKETGPWENTWYVNP